MPTPEDPHQPGTDDARRERLVLFALGEPVDESFERHLSTCAECSEDLDAYRHSVALARAGADDRSALEDVPPPSVWAGISRTLGLDATLGATLRATLDESRAGTADAAGAATRPTAPATRSVPYDVGPRSWSHPRRPDEVNQARYRRWRTALVAAAAAIVIGVSVTAGVLIGRDHGSPAAAQVLYQGQLSQQTGGPANVSGHATVHTQGGGLAVSVDSAGLPLRQGYYQVWLYDPAHKHMLPIGVLGRDGTGTFPLAADVDLRLYDIVDISAQDYDGVYTHKTTVLQGPLRQ
ncbi:MAG: anti-sigma factor [bacterium]